MNILITGASSGIGKELARLYLQSGNQVILCGRNKEALDQVKAEHGALATVITFDMTDRDATLAALTDVNLSIDQSLDLVILNAGICEYIDAQKFDAASFGRVIETNVLGVGNCLEALIPAIKPGGQLALMGSSSTFIPLPRAEAYGASKAAIDYLANTLAVSLKASKIDVSLISPGFVDTPLTDVNDFTMPMKITASEAAITIFKGLNKRKFHIHFPKRFTLILKAAGLLPMALQKFIAAAFILRDKS